MYMSMSNDFLYNWMRMCIAMRKFTLDIHLCINDASIKGNIDVAYNSDVPKISDQKALARCRCSHSEILSFPDGSRNQSRYSITSIKKIRNGLFIVFQILCFQFFFLHFHFASTINGWKNRPRFHFYTCQILPVFQYFFSKENSLPSPSHFILL